MPQKAFLCVDDEQPVLKSLKGINRTIKAVITKVESCYENSHE